MKIKEENISALNKLIEMAGLNKIADMVGSNLIDPVLVEKVKNPISNTIFILMSGNYLFEGFDYDFKHDPENLKKENYYYRMSFEEDEKKSDYEEILIQEGYEQEKKKYYYAKTGANSVEDFIEILVETIKLSNGKACFEEREDFLLTDEEFLVYCFMEDNEIEIGEENIINVNIDRSCSMAAVVVNGKVIMEGNEWDFHPSCHGLILPDFKNKNQLAKIFENMFNSSGNKFETIVNSQWKYE